MSSTVTEPHHAAAEAEAEGEQGGSSAAGSIFDVFSTASVEFDAKSDTYFVLGFKFRGMIVTALRVGQEMSAPVLLPFRRFRHDFAFQSHQVLHACFVPDAGSASGPLREGQQLVVTTSQEWFGGPTHVNSFDFATGVVLRRCACPHPSSQLLYAPATQKVYAICVEGARVLAFDVHEACASVKASYAMGENVIACATPVPGNLSNALFVGNTEGLVNVWDLQSGRPVPGMQLLAHDYGVRALQWCEAHQLLVTIGSPHPRRLQGLPPHVYAVLTWELQPWVVELRDGGAYAPLQGTPGTRRGLHPYAGWPRCHPRRPGLRRVSADNRKGGRNVEKDRGKLR